jgi:hypothetical protein
MLHGFVAHVHTVRRAARTTTATTRPTKRRAGRSAELAARKGRTGSSSAAWAGRRARTSCCSSRERCRRSPGGRTCSMCGTGRGGLRLRRWPRSARKPQPHPPAIAPTTMNTSCPSTTAAGSA